MPRPTQRKTKKPLRIGIFGLKCDPPHLFHLLLADEACKQFGLDFVWVVPAGQPVDKPVGATDKHIRLELARQAIRGNRKLKVSSIEVDREGPSYMADTLRAFKAQYPEGTEFYLIIGEDRAPSLVEWHEPEAIIALATILVGPRTSGAVTEEWLKAVLPAGARFAAIKIDNSSTYIRNCIERGESVRYFVEAGVMKAIRKLGLYGHKLTKPRAKRLSRPKTKPAN